jgi:bZIP-type transcription factor MBZ1
MSGAGQSVDPLDSLIDFSEYEGISAYQSPSLSPATTKTPFVRAASAVSTPTLATTAQPQLTGPSHQYELYKQQTGLVPGALASTIAVNQSGLSGYTNNYNLGLMTALSPENDLFDFNSDPSQGSLTADIDMDFDSPAAEPSFFFPDTVNPTAIGGQEASTAGGVGRLYPGMHSQAAMAKAQQQQRQQQQIIMQQQRQQQQQQQAVKPRSKSGQPTDPIVEQKITQLLNSMRAKSHMSDGLDQGPMMNIPRPKKDEDDMDEDERLLASEEGKKLSSKERRQLRNKVSARAFRSRRKGKPSSTRRALVFKGRC